MPSEGIVERIAEARRKVARWFSSTERVAQAVPDDKAQNALDRALRRGPMYPPFDPVDAVVTRGSLSLVRDTGSNMPPYNPRIPGPPETPDPAA